jgi:uncharacterized protein (TIGR03435 family)
MGPFRGSQWQLSSVDRPICVVLVFQHMLKLLHHTTGDIVSWRVDERERACDEQVLENGGNPEVYASAILKVCQFDVGFAFGVRGWSERRKKRIEEIMNHSIVRNLSGGRKLLFVTTGVTAFTVPLLVGMLNAPALRAQSNTMRSAVQTQDITGAWQGSLKASDREQRLVLRISLEENKLKAVLYRVDQGGQGEPATTITRNGRTIRVTLAATGITYEGELTSDGKAIAGTWAQGAPHPLKLARATSETAWAIPDPPPPTPMSADAGAVFEVVTIKPSKDDGVHLYLDASGVFHPTGPSLSDLIKLAYDVHSRQIVGGPSWLDREKYDLFAKPDKPGKPTLAQLKVMLQKLLADRYQLSLHHEKRELSVYAITVGKSESKLTRNDNDPNGNSSFSAGPRVVSLTNGTMADLANGLQRSGNIFDRPVVDQTGLGSARYDLIVKWTPLASQAQVGGGERRADDADSPPDLFTAFRQQLGLKLVSTKAPVDVLVIDHVEKPSEN